MASLLDLEKNAKHKGISPSKQNIKDVGANEVIGTYLIGYSAEGALKKSVDSLDGFCSYWEEQAQTRENLKSADDYIQQVNIIFNSYRTIRKNLDGSVAYLIGDWLLNCRIRFFPEDDRKTKGLWSAFLKEKLCNGFEKTTAYEFMGIADKLKKYRQNKLPLHTLKALLRAKNSGVNIEALDLQHISSKEIMAFREKSQDFSKILKANMIKSRNNFDFMTKELKKFETCDVDKNELSKLKNSVEEFFSILVSFRGAE